MKTLIVDDEPLARNELHYLLNEISGFNVIDEAENIEETLEKLLSETYDLVFLDINLMDESGIDLAQKIKKMKQPPHIILQRHTIHLQLKPLNLMQLIIYSSLLNLNV